MDEMSQCRPPEGAENHWFKHNDHGYRLYERISGTALGTFWMYRDFGGKSETLAAEGWTYHLPASPDDATERARLEREVKRLQGQIDAMRWVTNCPESQVARYVEVLGHNGTKGMVVGEPRPGTDKTAEELKALGFVGLYALDGAA